MVVITFLQLVDAVLTDRFSESKRGQAKDWVNYRYARIWVQEEWNFKKVAVTYAMSAAAQSVTLATLGLQRIEAVYDATTLGNEYQSVMATRPEDFHGWATRTGGRTFSFTVLGGSLMLDRPLSTATSLVVIGELDFVPLVGDSDVPLLPVGLHYVLVHGGTSEGLRIENDPTWQGFEQDYQAGLTDLKSGYLSAVRSYGDSYPAWP